MIENKSLRLMNDIHYGKVLILTEKVVPIEPDEDLELFVKCCEEVCKIAKEIEENLAKE